MNVYLPVLVLVVLPLVVLSAVFGAGYGIAMCYVRRSANPRFNIIVAIIIATSLVGIGVVILGAWV